MKFSYTIALIALFVCFNAPADYAQSTRNSQSQFNRSTMIQLKLRKAQECIDKGDYTGAKIYLNGVLSLDKNNVRAKQLLATCNNRGKSVQTVSTTLNLTKSYLSFTALGGIDNISITTNSSTYNVELLPSWCTVQKYSNYFVVTCNSNPSSTARNDYFTVTAGEKSARVYVNQVAKVETATKTASTSPTTLSVSKEYIHFDTKGGNSESIQVYSSTASYSISMKPSWCTINLYNGYFVLVCEPNYSNSRSDWFYVNAGDKQVKVIVNQNGLTSIKTSTSYKKSNPANLYLGIGALKPMIFKTDGKTFSNMEFGYSFTIGFVKTLGLYAKINTNFSSVLGDFTPKSLPTTYYGVPNTYSNSTFNRFGVVGGLMLKLNPIMLYVGAGKGHYYHFVKTDLYKYLDNSFVNTINLTTMSYNGLETDSGLIINFNKIGLSMGVSSFSFKYYEVNAGLGIRF